MMEGSSLQTLAAGLHVLGGYGMSPAGSSLAAAPSHTAGSEQPHV
jgi:hypothetical protein